MNHKPRKFIPWVLLLAGISIATGLVGCKSSQPAQQESAPSRFPLTGRVVSIDKAKEQVDIDAADIPGFMTAMEMNYSVKNPSLLDPLSPEDQIKADVVVTSNDMWIENIVVVKKPDQAKPTDSKPAHPDSPSTDDQK
jgi:hypothetical protein